MLSGTSSSAEPCQPAPSRMRRACAPDATRRSRRDASSWPVCPMWHDQSGRCSPFRADGAENVAPDIAGAAPGTGACSTLGPDTGESFRPEFRPCLLANLRFILNHISRGLLRAAARLLLPLLRSFFKTRIRVGSDAAARRQTPKAQACPGQQFAHHGDAEARSTCVSDQCAASALRGRPRTIGRQPSFCGAQQTGWIPGDPNRHDTPAA